MENLGNKTLHVEDPDKQKPSEPPRHAHRKSRTRPRISAACVRCQRRKIRCDGALPACNGCQKAGIPCVDGGTSRDVPRNYISELQKRVAWLESIVHDRLPDVDLDGSPDSVQRNVHQTEPTPSRTSEDGAPKTCTHQITEQLGLIAVYGGADRRFFGPSSGLFFTKFVLSSLEQAAEIETSSLVGPAMQMDTDLTLLNGFIEPQPQGLPSDVRHAKLLSQAYFDTTHLQYPFLHQPTYMENLNRLYDDSSVNAADEFQVFVVMAIGATVLARRHRRHFSADGYFASAMELLDGVFKSTSIKSLQCILLLEMYAMRDSASGLNIWSLHQHSISTCLELGLHRILPISSGIDLLELEMRTRVFWSVYCMDRLLSTTMGRPLALMDEQCELRIPKDVNDENITKQGFDETLSDPWKPTNMSAAIQLFKLAKFVSEVKCAEYCVDRDYPPYMSPAMTDANAWQESVLARLQQWKDNIPRYPEGDPRQYLASLCEIRYHELRMLILRPSPLFPQPSKAAIRDCFTSAIDCSKLYAKLNRENQLDYGWVLVHSLFLCTITIFYCVWTPSSFVDEPGFNFDCLSDALKSSSDILSAAGEYWPDAKRSRDVLDGIFKATTRYLSRRQRDGPGAMKQPQTQPSRSTDTFQAGVIQSRMDYLNTNLQPQSYSDADVDFPPYAAEMWDSFMTTDWLSYFTQPDGAQMDMTDMH